MSILLLFLLFILGPDDSLVSRVYRPHRLLLLDPHMTVSGVVNSIHTGFDGDYHINLKIKDQGLLAKNNKSDEDSCLVLEIVCVKNTMHICRGYTNKVTIPSVGDSIDVVGPYVFDKIHKITEIHPVERLRILKR